MEKTARMEKRKQAIRRVLARWFDHKETENGNKTDKAAETATDTVKMVTDDRKEPARTENSISPVPRYLKSIQPIFLILNT